MPAKHFDFYDYADDTPITCTSCGWSGSADECSKELHSELFDASCPRCDAMVAIVAFPTHQETRDAAGSGDERAIAALPDLDRHEAFLDRAAIAELKDPSQLPDIEGDRFELLWDQDGDDTVIRHGDREIWREVAYFEGGDRFADVFDLLRERYGWRLERLASTRRSELYLYGDRVSAALKRAEAGLPALDGDQLDFSVGQVSDELGGPDLAIRVGDRVIWRSRGEAEPPDAKRLAELEGMLARHYPRRVRSVRLAAAER